jgi:peptidoglycan lytic transglycosylase A
MFYFKFLLLIAGVVSVLNGCSKEMYDPGRFLPARQVHSYSSSSMILINQPYHHYLKGDDLSQASLKRAIGYSLAYYKKIPPGTPFLFGKLSYTAREIIASYELFLSIINKEKQYTNLIKELEQNFLLFQSVKNEDGEGVMFTGYYEPLFDGTLVKSADYPVPVYEPPDDLLVLNLGEFRDSLENRTIVYRVENNQVLPYYTRQEIMKNRALAGKSKIIAWMRDPVDLFFMQIQGSGILKLPSGEHIRLSYNGSNGHRYFSIGKLLVDEKLMKLEDVSMGSIRQYLDNHPQSRDRILYYNQSYTFFALDYDKRGPKGNINVPLTEHRSIAVDTNIFPKGALAYIETEMPVFKGSWQDTATEPFSRFAIVQDTGGAIKGPGRVDLFWGNGRLAEKSAGRMRSFGKLFILVAKKETLAALSKDQL